MHYLLVYDVGPDYVERRAAFREQHLGYARAAVERGELVLGGALAEPVDGAVLLFRGDSPAVAEAFATNDPYVVNGLVKQWKIRPWTTVVGPLAEAPIPKSQELGPRDGLWRHQEMIGGASKPHPVKDEASETPPG